MPTESAPPVEPPNPPSSLHSTQSSSIKCSLCGAGGLSSPTTRGNQGVVVLSDPIERICGGCVRDQERNQREENHDFGLGLDISQERGRTTTEQEVSVTSTDRIQTAQLNVPLLSPSPAVGGFSQSLPTQHTRPWTTASLVPPVIPEMAEERERTPAPAIKREDADHPPNPLLDIGTTRMPSIGRGALYPGSIFRGTQTSGRSAYEVEIKLLVSPLTKAKSRVNVDRMSTLPSLTYQAICPSPT